LARSNKVLREHIFLVADATGKAEMFRKLVEEML
jgi:hypothetical protein